MAFKVDAEIIETVYDELCVRREIEIMVFTAELSEKHAMTEAHVRAVLYKLYDLGRARYREQVRKDGWHEWFWRAMPDPSLGVGR